MCVVHYFAGGLRTPAFSYWGVPLYVLIIVYIIIQVADCTVDFCYVYMLL